jgi:hypothetical protein
LREIAELFPSAVKALILFAATRYSECFTLWRRFYELFGHAAPEGSGRDRQRRAEGVSLIEEWLANETEAVRALDRAVSEVT